MKKDNNKYIQSSDKGTSKMKKLKLTTKLTTISIFGAFMLMSGTANAQWAVKDVQTEMFFGPQGLFTQSMGQMQNAVKGAVDTMRMTQDLAIKQQSILSQQNDMRMRQALGEAEIAKRDVDLQPTVAQCIELTKNWSKVAAGGGSTKAGTTSVAPVNQTDRTEIKKDDDVQKMVASNKPKLQTCDAKDAAAGLEGCSGGAGDLAKADIKSNAIDANTSKADIPAVAGNVVGSDGAVLPGVIANYTLDEKGFAASLQNINNKVYYSNKFKSIDPEKIKDPNLGAAYKATYDLIAAKLDTAYNAMLGMARFSRAGDLPADSLAGKDWADSKADYDAIYMGKRKFPENPSLREMVDFNVYKDFFGVSSKNEELNDEKEILKSINKRLALSNLIAYKNYELLVDANKINSQLLTQSISPITVDDLEPGNAMADRIKTK